MGFKEKQASYLELIEAYLDKAVPVDETLPQSEVVKAMRYSLLGAGKRIRAQLVLGFCEGLGGDVSSALPAAAAIEMLHAYSLIHDDLPCMDDDTVRRGKPTCHIAFGEATALLAGDALLTHAFGVLSSQDNISRIGAERVLSQVSVLSRAGGVFGMIGGQVLDLMDKKDLRFLEDTDAMKTGALIKASAEMGCIAAGASPEEIDTATEYAGLIGLAFQIVDDILDVYGDAASLGKETGRDLKQNKVTYLTLLGRQKAEETAAELHEKAEQCLKKLGLRDTFLFDLTQSLKSRLC